MIPTAVFHRNYVANGLSVRISTTTFLLFILASSFMQELAAQDRRAQRRQFVEGMLKQLIENQLSPNERRPERRTNAAPTNPSANVERAVVSKMREIRANAAGFAQEASNLAYQLQEDGSRSSSVRSYIGEALRVSAAATLLSRRSNRTWDPNSIAQSYQNLDQDWRQLAFRLAQFRDLSYEAKRLLDRSNQYNQRLNDLFGIKPQVNRRDLAEHLGELSADVLNLLEDVDLEVDDSRLRQELLVSGRRAYAQARRISRLAASNTSHDALGREYNEFRRLMKPFATKIRDLDYRYLTRQLRRVQSADRKIQELLWLPTEIDQEELIHLTKSLQQDTQRLLDGVTLRQLTQLTEGQQAIVLAASEFHTACDDFVDCVQNGDDSDTLAELYYYLDEDWQDFSKIIRTINSRDCRQRRREIDRSIADVRQILGVRLNSDNKRGVELAAALENLAQHYDADIRKIFSEGGRYNREFRTECSKASRDFYDTTRQLHAEMARGASQRALQQRVNSLSKQWERLVAYSTRFPQTEQRHLTTVRRRLTPAMVEIQAMLR